MLESMEYLESPLRFVDFSEHGRCINCGTCCRTNFLPLSDQEIVRIRQYIKKYKIKAAPVVSKCQAMFCCPFRDDRLRSCKIYAVRPEVCRGFWCNLADDVILKRRADAHDMSQWTEHDLRATFYGAEPLLGAEVIKLSA